MLLSRVAETIYWMARYIERTENTARIIMVNANLLLDLPKGIAPGWEPILAITGSSDLFYEHYTETNERNVVKFLLSDVKNTGCMLSSLYQARECMRTVRAIVPAEAWEELNNLYYYANENKTRGLTRKSRYAFLQRVIRTCQLIMGNMSGSMSHDQTYQFVRIGRNIERADMTTRVIDVRAGNLLPQHAEDLKPFEDIQWKSVLDSLAAYQMYRRHVHLRVIGSSVLGFLLQDKELPRSVIHCLGEVESCLRELPLNESALRTLGRVQRLAANTDVSGLQNGELNDFINELQILLNNVHDQLRNSYFHVEKSKQKKRKKSTSRALMTLDLVDNEVAA